MSNFENIVRKALANGETLSSDEREHMRTLLSEYAAFKPIRAPLTRRSPFYTLRSHPAFASAFALLLLVTGSGGAVFAAEGALPGDILYPVKVEVNEPMKTALTPRGEAQVTWQLAIARRRLGEATALKAEGRLASSTEVALVSQAADATLKSATLASELPQSAATTSTMVAANASTTDDELVTASKLILEGRSRLKEHDDQGASKAFRASIRAAAKLQVLRETAGILNVDDEETISAPAEDDSSTHATSSDQGASVTEGIINIEREHNQRSDDATHTSASGTVRLFGD